MEHLTLQVIALLASFANWLSRADTPSITSTTCIALATPLQKLYTYDGNYPSAQTVHQSWRTASHRSTTSTQEVNTAPPRTHAKCQRSDHNAAQTDAKDDGDDFLARERALLGDDATQFTTNDDDLLGGGGGDGAADDNTDAAQFQNSFPEISNDNEVSRKQPVNTDLGY